MQHHPNKLRFYGEEKALTQQDVADSLGMKSTNRLSTWEKGTAIPSIGNLFKLVVMYKVKVEELYAPVFKEVRKEHKARNTVKRQRYQKEVEGYAYKGIIYWHFECA